MWLAGDTQQPRPSSAGYRRVDVLHILRPPEWMAFATI